MTIKNALFNNFVYFFSAVIFRLNDAFKMCCSMFLFTFSVLPSSGSMTIKNALSNDFVYLFSAAVFRLNAVLFKSALFRLHPLD
jgi:hypothetical protein